MDPEGRTRILCDKLREIGLDLRPDSRLCYSYIYGSLGEDWDLDRVVRECAMMHWLYTYTNYQYRIQQAYTYFSYVFNDGKTVNDFIKTNVQPHIKAETILSYGGIPERWPWSPTSSMENDAEIVSESPEETNVRV